MSIARILIIGLGSIGKRHLRLARKLLPNADTRVLRHQSANTSSDLNTDYFFNTEDALLFKPQVVVISNPAPFHIPTAQAFSEIGAHLLIEKPLSISKEGVAELLETCRQHKSILLVGYNLRFLTSLQQYRNLLLNEKVIGKILSVRCEIGQYLPSWRPDSDYRQSVSAQQKLGGGALLELSHELDYLRWIFGEVDWVKAVLSKQSNLDINVEDSAHIILGFTPTNDSDQQLIGTVNLDFIRHDTIRLCTAIGEKSSLRWDGLTSKVTIYDTNRNEWSEVFGYSHQRDDSYIAEWLHFIECINHKKTPLITGEDGLNILEIIEAARFSSTFSSKVHLSKTTTNSKVAQ